MTHNEEENLPRCFKSLDWVEEIIVIDDESGDKTVEVAKNFGAHVFIRKLDDFATQRDFALSKVVTEWVFLVDADEVVTKELKKEIEEAVKKKEYNGFYFPRKNIIFGKWIRHSGWYPDWQLHLFRAKKGTYHQPIHEQVKVEGRTGRLKNNLLHYNYESISQYLRKIDRYTDIEALSLFNRGYRFSLPDLFGKPTDEFLRRFFAEEGHRDGLHGLALAFLQAISCIVTLLKVWEKEKFKEVEPKDFMTQIEKGVKGQEKKLNYWFLTARMKDSPSSFTKLLLRLKRKFL